MNEPPGPPDWETLWLLRRGPLRSFPRALGQLQAAYGDVVAFRVPWRRFYLVSDPELIKDILVTRQHDFGKSHGIAAMRMLLGEGLLTSEPPLHRQMRRIVQPAFHRTRVESYARTFVERSRAFAPPVDGGSFDMHAAMMELALGIASVTLFGVDASDTAQTVGDALRDIMAVFPLALGPLAPIRRRLRMPSTRRFDRARRQLDGIVMQLIERRRGRAVDTGDVLSMLMSARDDESGFAPDDAQIRDEVMTLFIAGHETTANALTWTWYLLAQNPSVASEMRAEIDAVMKRGELGFADVELLPYTQRVLRESLRLYPPAWIVAREALCDVEIGGYRLKKGASVLMSQLLVHRSARFYPDPQCFDPDRWIGVQPPQFAYFPFGGGARRCIGEQFALVEMTLALATIAHRYEFELDPSTVAEMLPIVTLRPKHPIRMHAKPRPPSAML
jgi:cytochrome P450